MRSEDGCWHSNAGRARSSPGRNLERIEPVAGQLKSTYGIEVSALQLDTSSLASVRSAAAVFSGMIARGEIDALHAIVCNAGANFLGKVSYSVDGYENTFATNYLGHFLLVQLLLDHVAENGRIVFVASGTHDPDTSDGKFAGKAARPMHLRWPTWERMARRSSQAASVTPPRSSA